MVKYVAGTIATSAGLNKQLLEHHTAKSYVSGSTGG